MDRKFMEEATRLATESVEKGWGGPFGAVIVKDGEIIGRGQNRVLLTGCPVFHAEITAIIDASSRLNPKALLGSDYHAGTILEMIAHRSSLFRGEPRGYQSHRLLGRLPV